MKVLSKIRNPYNGIYTRKLNYSITLIKSKKKRFIIHIKDGFITYKITLKNTNNLPSISCQCDNFNTGKLCNHIFYLLYHHYQLPLYVIKLFHSWDDYYIDILSSNKNTAEKVNLIETCLNEKLNEIECGVCLETLNTPIKGKHELFECSQCYKLIHSCCLQRWLQKHNTCIYCRNTLKHKYNTHKS